MSNFKNSLYAPTANSSLVHSVESLISPESTERILYQLTNFRQTHINHLAKATRMAACFLHNQNPDTEFEIVSRLKSPGSAKKNASISNQNLLDAEGSTVIVKKILNLPKNATENSLENVLQSLEIAKSSSEAHPYFSMIHSELSKVLDLWKQPSQINLTDFEKGVFKHSLFQSDPEIYKNIKNHSIFWNMDVFLNHAINQSIFRLNRLKSGEAKKYAQEIANELRTVRSTTTDGKAYDMHKSFIAAHCNPLDFDSSLIHVNTALTVLKGKKCNRIKSKIIKDNGYSAHHSGLIDNVTGMPYELKFMSEENYILSQAGPSAHNRFYAPSRKKESINHYIDIKDDQNLGTELCRFFTPDYMEDLWLNTPDFIKTTIDSSSHIHSTILTPAQNFLEMYSPSLNILPQKIRDYYYLGLQTDPRLRKIFDGKYSSELSPNRIQKLTAHMKSYGDLYYDNKVK